MFNNSLIKLSGQYWKAKVVIYGSVVGGVALFGGLLIIDKGTISFWIMITGMLIGILTFIIGCIIIRCPVCGSRWLWVAIKNQSLNSWLLSLANNNSCPECGSQMGPEPSRK